MPKPIPDYYTNNITWNPADGPQDRMALAAEHMKSAMPTEMAGTTVRPVDNAFLRWLMPKGALAGVHPLMPNTVMYRPDSVPIDQSSAGDLLAHELTHVKQNRRNRLKSLTDMVSSILGMQPEYMDRPNEQEAFETMRKRVNLRHDIPLTPDKK